MLKKSLFACLILALSMPAFADVPTGGSDDEMIEVGSQPLQPEGFSPETHDMEPITIKDEATGADVVGGYLVTEKETGERIIVGAGETSEIAKLRLNLIVRLKFPEIFGVRAGLEYDSFIEAGIDIGVGIFFNNVGAYLNVFPMYQQNNALKNIYVGGHLNKEVIWAIFGTVTGPRAEAVVGYRGLWGKKNLWFGFVEMGMGRSFGTVTDNSAWGGSSTHPVTEPLVLPTIALGVGYSIGKARR